MGIWRDELRQSWDDCWQSLNETQKWLLVDATRRQGFNLPFDFVWTMARNKGVTLRVAIDFFLWVEVLKCQ